MYGTFGLIYNLTKPTVSELCVQVSKEQGLPLYHLITPPNEDGHGACVSAVFDDEHSVPGRTKGHFAYYTCLTELCR
jgi:hypothetical protein